MLTVAVEHLHLSLNDFWGMTPSEFDILTNAHIDRLEQKAGRLPRRVLAELEAVGRDAMAKEDAARSAQAPEV